MKTLVNFILNGIIVMLVAYLLPGVRVDGFLIALLVALVLALVNTFLRPILVIFTLPATIFTLGLFIFVINALLVLLVDWFIPGFEVAGFLWALAFSLSFTIGKTIVNMLFNEKEYGDR